MRNELKNIIISDKSIGYDLNKLFMINFDGNIILGKKNISEYKKNNKSLSLLDENGILGFYQSFQFTENSILFYFYPIEECDKITIFNKILHSYNPYIYHPFPIIDKYFKEKICESEYWNNISHTTLNNDEIHFRKYTIFILKEYYLKGKIFYDPACSTGKFLSEIKGFYPEITAIGSDISEMMINKANLILDRTFSCNAANCPLPDEYCDFLIIRFLNAEVIKMEDAYKTFDHLQRKVKRNCGFIIIFGHTSILLNIPYISFKYNLKILNTIGYSADKKEIFQYFVLKKL